MLSKTYSRSCATSARPTRKPPTDLKRLYLGLFWDQFKAEDKVIVEATKSPIVRGLEATGALVWNTTQKPDSKENRAFAKTNYSENITTDETVIISPVRGDYWESNPD